MINLLPKKLYLSTIRYGLIHNYGFLYIYLIFLLHRQGTYEEKERGKIRISFKIIQFLISFIHTDSLLFCLKRISLVSQKNF